MLLWLESIFYSVIDDTTALSETTMLMTRVDFVYALVKVALRSADDSVRNVSNISFGYVHISNIVF